MKLTTIQAQDLREGHSVRLNDNTFVVRKVHFIEHDRWQEVVAVFYGKARLSIPAFKEVEVLDCTTR